MNPKLLKTIHDVGIRKRYYTKDALMLRVERNWGRRVAWSTIRKALKAICEDPNTNANPTYVEDLHAYTFRPNAHEVNGYEKRGLRHMTSRAGRHLAAYDKATAQLADYRSELTQVESVRPPLESE